jgi:hypothetical protein
VRARTRHLARKVARENSSNESVPSWFASNWSNIRRAWLSCAAFASLGADVFPDVSLDAPPMPAEGAGIADDGGVAGAGGGVAVGVVDCASVEADGIDEAEVSAVVAHAAPAMPMIETPIAVTSFLCTQFIGTPFRDDARHERRGDPLGHARNLPGGNTMICMDRRPRR